MTNRLISRILSFILAGNLFFLPACLESQSRQTGTQDSRSGQPLKTIIDSRGKEILIPRDPQRIASISDALVEELMIVFGVQDRLVGIGSTCLIREFHYDYESETGDRYTYRGGMNPALFLDPSLKDLPLFVQPGSEINYETLAGLNPDVVIVDAGSCTLPWRRDREMMEKSLERLESLGIPTVVLQGLNCSNPPRIEALSSVIKIVGQIFEQPEKASTLADYLENSVKLITERTREISEKDRAEVLMLGLDPQLRAQGTVGTVYGSQDVHSYFVEELVNARNAFEGNLATATMSLEHLFKIDPDVIILPTANGYHPPRELYEESFFQNLKELRAIRDRRVAALPWSPCNCDKRLEYPVDIYIIAVTAYPELFPDLNLTEWVLQFYRDVYGLDPSTADGLLSAQWLDWLRKLE